MGNKKNIRSTKKQKIEWMVSNYSLWLPFLKKETDQKELRELKKVLCHKMKDDGIYSPTTLNLDINVHKLIELTKEYVRRESHNCL